MRYEKTPKAVLFDIGMTIVFPSSKVLIQEIQKVLPDTSFTSQQVLRALALAAEAHHLNLSEKCILSPEEKVGSAFGFFLDIPVLAGMEIWRSASKNSNLYSEIDKDASHVLRRIREHGIKTAAISNSDNCLRDELVYWNIYDCFDCVIGSDSGYCEKPNPDMFEVALESIGVEPENAWHVGDGLINDVLGANRAGIRETILVDPHNIYQNCICRKVRSVKEILNSVEGL